MTLLLMLWCLGTIILAVVVGKTIAVFDDFGDEAIYDTAETGP